jgi:hypothetical protein
MTRTVFRPRMAIAAALLAASVGSAVASGQALNPVSFTSLGTLDIQPTVPTTYTVDTNTQTIRQGATLLFTGTTGMSGGGTVAVFTFDNITIGGFATVKATGRYPVVFLSKGAITVRDNAVVDVRGVDGAPATVIPMSVTGGRGGAGGAGGPGGAGGGGGAGQVNGAGGSNGVGDPYFGQPAITPNTGGGGIGGDGGSTTGSAGGIGGLRQFVDDPPPPGAPQYIAAGGAGGKGLVKLLPTVPIGGEGGRGAGTRNSPPFGNGGGLDPLKNFSGGGGGGGGGFPSASSAGGGGGGGGGLQMVAVGPLQFLGAASILASGGRGGDSLLAPNGDSGAGGGGGTVILSGSVVTPPAAINAAGGAGGTATSAGNPFGFGGGGGGGGGLVTIGNPESYTQGTNLVIPSGVDLRGGNGGVGNTVGGVNGNGTPGNAGVFIPAPNLFIATATVTDLDGLPFVLGGPSGQNGPSTGVLAIRSIQVTPFATVRLGAPDVLEPNSTVIIDSRGNFITGNPGPTTPPLVAGYPLTIARVTGSGVLTILGAPTASTLTVGFGDANGVFQGVVNGTGSLVKIGGGQFEVAGLGSNFSGTATVNAGTLAITGVLPGTFTVNNGGTLSGGNGDTFVGQAKFVTVNSCGTLRPATLTTTGTLNPGQTPADAGLMSAESVTLSAGANFLIDIAGTSPGLGHSRLDVTGTLDLGGSTLVLQPKFGFISPPGATYIIATAGTLTGTFAGLAEGATVSSPDGTFRAQISYVGNRVTLTAPTETSSVTLAPGTPNPSTVGQNVSFTATVTVSSGSVDGTVNFYYDGILLGSQVPDMTTGVATLVTSGIPLGVHQITASFVPNDFRAPSLSAPVGQTVLGVTAVALAGGVPNPSIALSPVTFVATVTSPSGTPTGTVTFFSDGTLNLGTVAVGGTGTATLVTPNVPLGTHTITAVFAAAGAFTPATSNPVTQTVTGLPTSVLLRAGTPDPSLQGQPVTFSVSVASAGAVPTGSVVLRIVGRPGSFGTTAVDGLGNGTIVTRRLPIGDLSVFAEFVPTGVFVPGASTARSIRILPQPGLVVVGADAGGGPSVVAYDASPTRNPLCAFFPFEASFTGGVRVAVGDVSGDSFPDLIVGAGPGGAPMVKIYDGALLRTGVPTLTGVFLAYERTFGGGVNVAAADTDGDGLANIITAPALGGQPLVKVFRAGDGALQAAFMAYEPGFVGGVNVAAADFEGTGFSKIVTAPNAPGGPLVKVFNSGSGALENVFLAYELGFLGGVYVAAGDLNGDGVVRIVTGPGQGGGPILKVFDQGGTLLQANLVYGFGGDFTGGVRVAVGNAGLSSGSQIVTGPGPGSFPLVQVRTGADSGVILGSFYGTTPAFPGGVFVAR